VRGIWGTASCTPPPGPILPRGRLASPLQASIRRPFSFLAAPLCAGPRLVSMVMSGMALRSTVTRFLAWSACIWPGPGSSEAIRLMAACIDCLTRPWLYLKKKTRPPQKSMAERPILGGRHNPHGLEATTGGLRRGTRRSRKGAGNGCEKTDDPFREICCRQWGLSGSDHA